MFLKVLQTSQESTCVRVSFLKDLPGESVQLYKKDSNTGGVFLQSLQNFSYRTLLMTASAPPVVASVFFFKKVYTIKQLFSNLAMNFVVNCQVF